MPATLLPSGSPHVPLFSPSSQITVVAQWFLAVAPHSLAASLPRSLAASLPSSLAPSLPRCLTPSFPRSFAASLPRSLAPSLQEMNLHSTEWKEEGGVKSGRTEEKGGG